MQLTKIHLDKFGKLLFPSVQLSHPIKVQHLKLNLRHQKLITKSNPLIESNIAMIININKNEKIKIITDLIKSSEIHDYCIELFH